MTVTNTVLPALTGTAQQGQTLTTSDGTWTFDLDYLTYAYQWLRCDGAGANCVSIPGATSQGYTLTSSDVGHKMRSEVTATEHAGSPTPPSVWKELNSFDDFSLAWNKWQDQYQGSPTSTSPPHTQWASPGGIFEVSTPYGPGFHHIVTPAMIYQSTGDTKMARLSWGNGTPSFLDFYGRSQVWDWYWNLPAADNASGFPSAGLGPGELLLTRTTMSDGVSQPGYVGHGFNLGFVNSVLRFQFFRSTGNNTFAWTYGPNVVLDRWYHFRWEIKWISDSTGYIRAFTDDMVNPWVFYTGPTIINNQQIQLVFCSLRNDFAWPTNGIIYGNLTITDV